MNATTDPNPSAADDPLSARSEARRQKQRGGEKVFCYLAQAATDGRWRTFMAAVSELADISESGVEVLLEHPEESLSWSQIYNAAGLPIDGFKPFIRIIQIALQHDLPGSPYERRAHVLAQLSSPAASNIALPAFLSECLSRA